MCPMVWRDGSVTVADLTFLPAFPLGLNGRPSNATKCNGVTHISHLPEEKIAVTLIVAFTAGTYTPQTSQQEFT